MVKWRAALLRIAAEEWYTHIHDEPQDVRDSACRQRMQKLARAACEYAMAKGVVRVLHR